ncbi:ABC transporter substrate-binding protein [Phenylobacterium sp.]|uniref:substrate-binding periplasmic protein n=1 Tax=Phenylobacterium sp. TaxID=1871053 RepID=UPI0025D70449|nr:ABC transporter substrate-binding protein [Phenylobacterium sp.]
MRRGLVTGVILSLFTIAAPAMADTLDDAAKRGALKICVVEGAPYALKTPSGRWIGHEIDIGQRLATDFGLAPEFVSGSYADVIGRLNKGECDLIAASLAIEPDRLRQAWFTTPYSETDVSIVVARKAPVRIADLDKADVVIGAVAGAPAILLAKSTLPAATIEVFPDLLAAERALEGGAIVGLAHKAPIPRLLAVKAPDKYAVVEGEPLARTADAFAVRKGDADLLNTLNGWVEARKRDGFLDRTNNYWLSTLDWTERLKPRSAAGK